MKHTYQQPTISVITPVTEYHLLDGSQERKGDTSINNGSAPGSHADSNSAGIWETDEENTETIWGTKQEW